MVGENVGVGSREVDLSTAGPLFTDLRGAQHACLSAMHHSNTSLDNHLLDVVQQ